MLRLRYPGNQFFKRTIRPKYAQYQATSFAATLDPSYLGENEESGDPDFYRDIYNFPSNVYLVQGGLIPGLVLTRTTGTNVVVASGTKTFNQAPLGLLGQFVGGNLDELGGNPYVSAWRGFDSTYVLIAPAFNPEGLSARIAEAKTGENVPLYCGPDGRLSTDGAGSVFGEKLSNHTEIGYVLNYQPPSLLEISLKI